MSQTIMALDPGNSTGWVVRTKEGTLVGGTVAEDHKGVWEVMCEWMPDVLIYETFQMYPGKAQKLIWNTFYPCEVIGVIKLWDKLIKPDAIFIGLQPSVKKYALGTTEQELWKTVDLRGQKATEHVRDAVRLLRYYERNY